MALGVVFLVAVGLALTGAFSSGSLIERPSDPCQSPPPLRTFQGVTLQPEALRAFRQAQRVAAQPISVVESYRSCSKQALACRRICGSSEGCPGSCARPGSSYHQLGAAIDITQAALDTPAIVAALKRAGWCQPLPGSDPGHFSFGGCH